MNAIKIDNKNQINKIIKKVVQVFGAFTAINLAFLNDGLY